ncbi:hypothetical protein [Polynucleobacter sp. QLW-P1DATA-2]|uniref:hypothetical protein n=1 Tax=Polynucleobacter sp. QLW-P1DATA-2 TaxID=1743167 RepID=UPI0011604CD7|nr:hypothetical protein [Polynucleobacter sp. QLW-P1DATA-2]
MKRILVSRWEVVVLLVASLFSTQLGRKGFAGFDLSPMISANNILISGMGNEYSIDNPMSPGFSFIVHIFTRPFSNNYLSYFYGNQLFVAAIFLISTYLINYYAKNNCINKSTVFISKISLTLICIPTLITDGHFYISDTSDIFCCVLIFLTSIYFISRNSENMARPNLSSPLKNIILIISTFPLLLKPNIGLPTFLFVNGLILLSEIKAYKNVKALTFEVIKNIFFITSGGFIWINLLNWSIGLNINNYLNTIKLISQNRASLNLSLIDVKVLFPLTILSGEGLHHLINFGILTSVLIFTLIFFSKNILKIERIETGILCVIVVIYSVLNNQYDLSGYNLLVLILIIFYSSVFIALKRSNNYKFTNFIFAVLALCVGILSIICLATNFDVKSSDFPILFTSLGIGMIIQSSLCNYQLQNKKLGILIALVILLIFSAEGYQRVKIILAGPPSGFRDFGFEINNKFFIHLKTTKFHQEVDSEIQNFMATTTTTKKKCHYVWATIRVLI